MNQYDLLGDNWRLEFLILSVFHGVCAYFFSSRTLLAVAITALASWLGLSDSGVGAWLDAGAKSADLANRGLLCAAVILIWQQIHIRLHSLPDFIPVFAHFIANVALLASLSMVADTNREVAGLLLLVIFGTLAVLYGVRSRREPFAIYGVGYALVGLDFFMLDRRIHTGALVAAWLLISTAVAAVLIFRIHRSFRSEP